MVGAVVVFVKRRLEDEAEPRRSELRGDVASTMSGDGGSRPASDAAGVAGAGGGDGASLLERGTPRRSVQVRDGRYPVLVKRGGVLEGPVTMRLKNGQLYYGRTRETFAVDEAPVILKHRSKRKLGFVVSASVARTARWETPRALCAFHDGTYEVTPDFISSKLDTRAILAMGLAVKRPWTVLFALLGGGAGVGFFVVAVIGIGTSTISSMLSRGG